MANIQFKDCRYQYNIFNPTASGNLIVTNEEFTGEAIAVHIEMTYARLTGWKVREFKEHIVSI